MGRVILAIAVAFGLAGGALAQQALPRNPTIEATIQGQFDAFQAEDVTGAWHFASPAIQGIFITPQAFGQMVQRGYPMVWDPAQVEYLGLREISGNILQRVQVVDQAGALHLLDYEMVPTGEAWKINAVTLLRAPQVGA